jgi:hypothetical protein
MADLAVNSNAVPEDAIEEVEMDVAVKNSVHQRLRANSSIMQLKKLLGKFLFPMAHASWLSKHIP